MFTSGYILSVTTFNRFKIKKCFHLKLWRSLAQLMDLGSRLMEWKNSVPWKFRILMILCGRELSHYTRCQLLLGKSNAQMGWRLLKPKRISVADLYGNIGCFFYGFGFCVLVYLMFFCFFNVFYTVSYLYLWYSFWCL